MYPSRSLVIPSLHKIDVWMNQALRSFGKHEEYQDHSLQAERRNN